jgi:hypothetical protein
MFKRVKNIASLKPRDKFVLYGISDTGSSVVEVYYEMMGKGDYRNSYRVRKLNAKGEYVYNRWFGGIKSGEIRTGMYDDNALYCDMEAYYPRLYTDPKKPCEKMIQKLIKKKQNINKQILNYQKMMYKTDDV